MHINNKTKWYIPKTEYFITMKQMNHKNMQQA